MPKRTDIKKILLIGSGPIVIGQACEFDYSGSQAARSLRAEGYEVILVNSNPATIMTDPVTADKIFLQELTPESIKQIVEQERPDAVLPTMGGQTALNLANTLHVQGYWEKMGVDVIGVDIDAINITEDRQLFRDLMEKIGIDQARSRVAKSLLEAKEITQELGGIPVVIRPSFTMGGSGGGIVWNPEEFDKKVMRGLELSPVHEVLMEECLVGWKEFELELLRDEADNVIIICAIENVDPMGVHTGDSVTVAPAQTLTDKQYQIMRDAAIRMMRSIGTFAGGCNVQFAVDPATGRMIAIEINPRVSRSSALASKATGYPIAKVASKLAVGYTLDELKNDVTGTTSACFEPALDYVITKIPRFNFEKFEGVDEELTTQMKAVGEVMAIGRSFPESLQKAWQSLENGYAGLGADRDETSRFEIRERLKKSYWDRTLQIRNAFKLGASVEEIGDITKVDPWFLFQIQDIVAIEEALHKLALHQVDVEFMRQVKRFGFSDLQIAYLVQDDVSEEEVRNYRKGLGLKPSYQLVDTCAGEFPAKTPYFYSSYESNTESVVSDKEKVLILGSGPNRIGQGIEFDYSCVHGVLASKEMGYEAIMVNCNPETVSTDFDVADKLYFEPVFWERVRDIIEHENPSGVIVQLGGQTALKLARYFDEHNIPILGTQFDNMDLAEDRSRFSDILKELEIPYPPYGTAQSVREAVDAAEVIGYPSLVRPSYVLGGQGMRIAINKEEVEKYTNQIWKLMPDNMILLDLFLEDGIELDVDAICDGEEVWVAGIMQHIEPAGVHSGDSTAVLPPYSISEEVQDTVRRYISDIALRLGVLGLVNVQMVVKGDIVYVIEANPRASRTVPFVAKATGIPISNIATKVMLGEKLATFRERGDLESSLVGFAVKEPVFSWDKFPEVRKELGPEMKSTGEAIAFIKDFDDAHFRKPFEMRNLYLSR
ncbi:MAG: carbamoyl-phosphate synthase large subunit [Bacteroidetes Order II. Incertae sedis bacterium]|jgi:carbamoyl-phosphate synthase large subunit|nr:carbamoyl-phosphate synthase large subunit [Bacteroidetes Order II. bacterium]MBT5250158.1 carbamoyl-phosphate synthase large subunit [Bacteroidetes Order II. bacterium]MBT6201887.1 carbamoyl-phosphate synthase large subunit [Bacteroidetes Order II. bacterium]MBT6424371.1 carbamoyl-phosphate synthase large subunit [Bacteroidetes Order II. bacterium]MBT6599583.1 carbamoyl-phosphate synthase large subunit [Bacteroidetes Order II. bacterium]